MFSICRSSFSRTVPGELCDGQQQPPGVEFPMCNPAVRSGDEAVGQHPLEDQEGSSNVKDSALKPSACQLLTVWRKSLLLCCNGFTVIDSSGNLAYRVDNYTSRQRLEELVLMDAEGSSILTLRHRKKLGISESWLIYEGDVGSYNSIKRRKKPIFRVKKQSKILRDAESKMIAYVCSCSGWLRSERRRDFVIEGSYVDRSCKVVEKESREVVAEVRRKEETVRGVSFGLEVFVLAVQPGFDAGFAMALVLLLDQMFS